MKNNVRILPSLASASQLNLEKQIQSLGEYPYLHLDIEDGNFVPNITFGIKTVREISQQKNKQLDIHLMVTKPENYLNSLLELEVGSIAFHIESVMYPAEYLRLIRNRGTKAGLALNFKEQLESVFPYVNDLDYVLIMTSEPDGKGQIFNPYILEKIKKAREILPMEVSITADGGISEENMKIIVQNGAEDLVMGRSVWKSNNVEAQINYLRKTLNEGK